MSDENRFITLVFSLLASLFFIIIFITEAAASDAGKCKYPSIISYFPLRVIGCELGKRRWEEK